MQPITVLIDHADFVIIDKPAGIPVQNEPEVEGILPRVCRQLNVDKLWLVHRLDKVTSGALILAKNSQAAAQLSGKFAARQVEKFYLALSDKKPKKKQGSVAGDMKKVRNGQFMLQKSLHSPAVTQFFSYGTDVGLRLFLLKPYTGKTHQLRVTMKSLGCAILGDEMYKGSPADRTYLHAYAVGFNFQGQRFEVVCPPSMGNHFSVEDVHELISGLSEPWDVPWPSLKASLLKQVLKENSEHE